MRQVYLSTLPEVTARPFDAIWIRPLDYREATEGTQFEAGREQRVWAYRRQSAREEFVEGRVRKQRVLADDTAG